jgi:hypothetical protein
VIIGAATSTGTASQNLQVSGGAYVSGNLGVGNTNPQNTLDVGIGTIRLINKSSTGRFSQIYQDNELIFSNSSTNDDFSWTNGSGSRMRLYGAGNLVIPGTFTPTGTASQRLQVDGGAYVSGSVGIGTTNPEKPLHLLTSIATPLIIQRTATNNSAAEYRNSTSSMWAGLAGNANGWGVGASANLGTDAQILVTRTGGELLVGRLSATGTSSQKLQVESGAYVSGNLGIGTTNPLTPLQVETYGIKTGVGTFAATVGVSTTLDSFSVSSTDFKIAEYTVHIGFGSSIQAQKVLVTQDQSTAYAQEYGVVYNNSLLVSIGATISGGNCILQATPQTGVSGLTTYRFTRGSML